MFGLIQVYGDFALIATFCASEKSLSTFRADITCFFIAGPFFSAVLSPAGDGPQDDFFAHVHGKVFDVLTGKRIAFVTAAVTFFPGTGLDGTRPAKKTDPVGQTAFTLEVFDGNTLKTRNLLLVHGQELV